jgi:flagellar biosynthesis anti-sigma factor FlgM
MEVSKMKPLDLIGPTPLSPGVKGTQAVQKKYQSQDKDSSTSVMGKDEASVSDSARVLAKAYAALSETPEVRSDRIEELRAEIASGQYAVPHEKLAELLAKRIYKAV